MKLDREAQALEELVAGITAPMEHHALYAATVIKDHGDMTLDVEPDSPKLAQMTRVRMASILPDCKVKVKQGARVLIGFENGEQTKPRYYLWQSGSLEYFEIKTALGQTITIDDDRENKYLNPTINIIDSAQQRISYQTNTGMLTIKANVQINLDAPVVLAGGKPVAHVGDKTSTGGVILPL